MSGRLKITRGSGNVFADLGFDKAEAENLKLRAELMMRIDEFYRKSGMTQAQAAQTLGLTQPRLNALLKGKIGLRIEPMRIWVDADAFPAVHVSLANFLDDQALEPTGGLQADR